MCNRFLSQLLVLCFLYVESLFTLSLQERFNHNDPSLKGSFVVTEYQKTTSFLRIHSISPSFLMLEEINIPSELLPKKITDWDAWLHHKAPHHTSWLLYRIDLNLCKIVDCYSFSRKSYVALHEQQSFLTQLMSLPLEPIPESERKRIGSKSDSDELDMRKVWNPPKIVKGSRVPNPHFQAMRTKWPKDESELSGKLIDLYFDQDNALFPFPYWIEIGDGHNLFKIRAIDSGISLSFPFDSPPPKAPEIEAVSLSSEGLSITLRSSFTCDQFQVILSSSHEHVHKSISLPHKTSSNNLTSTLLIPRETLSQHLGVDYHTTTYHLCIIPLDHPSLMIEYPHPIRLPAFIKDGS